MTIKSSYAIMRSEVEDVVGSINAIRISTRKLRGCVLQSGLPSFLR